MSRPSTLKLILCTTVSTKTAKDFDAYCASQGLSRAEGLRMLVESATGNEDEPELAGYRDGLRRGQHEFRAALQHVTAKLWEKTK